MIQTIKYLKLGNLKQSRAFSVISDLGIMDDLSEYHPTLCGTLPLGIDIEGSDLDIIMEVANFNQFEKKVKTLYGDQENFILKKLIIRDFPVIKANFIYKEFEFELFGQQQPVNRQYAYLHMIIENVILEQLPLIKEEVIRLKEQGYKTEPAFCKVLGLEGDPYERLVEFGKEKGFIEIV
ncbi:DUF4269 domain-containing protein [Psychrobacillus vulpis]|uniref:DUF4269 domain-containing protein n=1 Tax=Psychrobacillus vulpis TaxID=2325572 RepID=A0A544TJB0_9BACI|nr:DUF4269 domain-containing protein [Psychrobacillus vulpis]TQR17544.1 DUF4269 domain-containing protein [Psychrobacillus vulpis]